MHPLKRLNGQASVLAVLQSEEEEEEDGPSGGGLPQVHERADLGRVRGQDDARPQDDTSWRKTLAG